MDMNAHLSIVKTLNVLQTNNYGILFTYFLQENYEDYYWE